MPQFNVSLATITNDALGVAELDSGSGVVSVTEVQAGPPLIIDIEFEHDLTDYVFSYEKDQNTGGSFEEVRGQILVGSPKVLRVSSPDGISGTSSGKRLRVLAIKAK